MILLNNFSLEFIWPIFTKFHVDSTLKQDCSNGYTPLTVMPIMVKKNKDKNTFFFKTKNCSNDDPFISCNDGIEKCCVASAYLQWLFHADEPAVNLLFLFFPEIRI